MTEQTLDVHASEPPEWAIMPAEDVYRDITEPETGVRAWRRKPSTAPVVQINDRYLTGTLDLRAVEFPYLLEFVRCRFENPPDLRQAKLAGVTFHDCWLPGVQGRNLRSANDLVLYECTVDGASIDLTDATIDGSLILERSTLHNPGGRALHANRLVLAGALLAARIVADGELRMPGLRVGGNINLRGAHLTNPNGLTLNANAAHIAGNLLANADYETGVPFVSTGLLFMTSAHIASDLVLRGAQLTPKQQVDEPPPDGDMYFDIHASLVADRLQLQGNALLDIGLRSTGTLRMVNAQVRGSLRLAGAHVDVTNGGSRHDLRALNLDATEVAGDLNARNMFMRGQARMVDVTVRGSVTLEESTVLHPRGDVIEARRFSAGGNLDWHGLKVAGSVLLQGATIGANLNLRGGTFVEPGSYEHDGSPKPSLDIRAATIGRDLLCGSRGSPFFAGGGVRIRRAQIGREATFVNATLGEGPGGIALDAFGVNAQELVLHLGAKAGGTINLQQARCASFHDDKALWDSKIDLHDFRYESLAKPVELTDDARITERLEWMYTAMAGTYRPGPYDQLASVLRANGNEEHAATVLIAKQRHRYSALARGFHVLGAPVLLWSWLQRWMVGYGYRPMRALVWLVLLLVIGTLWFSWLPGHCQPIAGDPSTFSSYPVCPVTNQDDHLVWNPFLLTLDLLVPIVDFGNKNRWALPGTSQWIASALIASGWILATTVAAGMTRMLRRNG